MRFLNIIIVFLIAFSFSGIAIYAVGPNLSTEAVAQRAFQQLEQSGKMEEMVRQIESDPNVSAYMEQLEVQLDEQAPAEQEVSEGILTEEDVQALEEQTTFNSLEIPPQEDLAFETKEEAANVVIKKVGFRNLLKMKEAVETDEMSAQDVMVKLEEDLSEEEMLALKVMIFKEWQN